MTSITQTEAERLLADLSAEYAVPDFDSVTEITARQLAKRISIATDTARKRLNAEVAQGKMTKRWVVISGCRIAAYRWVENSNEAAQ